MAGSDLAIGALKLFTFERPDWTVEQLAQALKASTNSAYRYVATLENAGLLATVTSVLHTLGPAIIQHDRQIQLTDQIRDRLLTQPASADLTGTWGCTGTGEPSIMPIDKRIP